jgi:hypothetical protein
MYAFPALIENFIIHQIRPEKDIERPFVKCYTIRTFDRFLELFNLTKAKFEDNFFYRETIEVKTSAIFKEVFLFDE